MMRIDARLPLRFGLLADRRPGDAVVTDTPEQASPPAASFDAAVAHASGCVCCNGRSAAAVALAGLFRDKVVQRGVGFTAVLACVGPAGEAQIRAALADEPLVFARFRLG